MLFKILTTVPPLIVAVVLHEVAHGWIAEKLGDPTARRLGRITLNPIKHVDPMFTVVVPGILIAANSPFIFGGAKPVPVNPLYFKNPRRGMAYVALAGPVLNFLLAMLCYLLMVFVLPLIAYLLPVPFLVLLLNWWCAYGILINLVLGLFNLLPIPPLDGGRIVVGVLPIKLAKQWAKVEPFGLLIVIALLFSGLLEFVLAPVLKFLTSYI